tara:strand:+ start:13157 stop:14080 length:924 start_codon:yes stop_codon:yes gene_type:complete
MIKLKDLLTESRGPVWIGNKWFPAHTQTTLTNLKYGDKIALYPKLHEKMFGKIPVSSFHVTNPNNLNSLTRILGKKKSISTFTRANHDSPLAKGRGIQTGTGGVIFYLQGHLLAKRYMDFDTVPDKTGRRWIESHYITGDRMIFKNAMKRAGLFKKLEKLEDKIRKIDKKFENLWLSKPLSDPDRIEYDDYKRLTAEESGTLVAKYIKEWFDWQNKWLMKNKSKIKKNLINPEDKPSAWWNEILMYNPKIIDVFVMERITRQSDWWQIQPELEKILSRASGSKPLTTGTPAQFRKWYKKREGKLDQV